MFRTASQHLTRIHPSFPPQHRLAATPSPLHQFIEKFSAVSHDASLHNNLITILNEENDPLFSWAKTQLSLATQQSLSINCSAARQAAQAGTLINALLETCCYLKKYRLARPDDSLLECIEQQHRQYLISSLQSSFYSADDESKCRLIAAVEERAWKNMGIEPDPLIQQQAWMRRASRLNPCCLNESELLALCDYVNSSTGIFNIVNAASRSAAYYGIDYFQNIIQIYIDTLNASLHKLQSNRDFGKQNLTIHKGIHLGRLDGRFNLAHLEHAYHHGSLIAFPHPISGTIDPNESYAHTKHDIGYHYELMLTIPTGADVDILHDSKTRGQKEIIAPSGLRFCVTGRYQRDVAIASTGSIASIQGYQLIHMPH